MLACPWDVPTAEWDKLAPKIEKCTHCADRTSQPAPDRVQRGSPPPAETSSFLDTIMTPACVKACPADCLRYGTRDEMLAEAHKRIGDRPEKYVDHIYGENELGGTSVLYLSSVPFAKLGFPTFGRSPFRGSPRRRWGPCRPPSWPSARSSAAAYSVLPQRVQAVAAGRAAWTPPTRTPTRPSVEFETLAGKLLTPFN